MVSVAALDEIRLDMAGVVAAARALLAASDGIRSAAENGARSWSGMPAAFEMSGVSAAMPAMTHRSTAVATDLADSVEQVHALLDRASFDFAELRTRRAALVEQISTFVKGPGRRSAAPRYEARQTPHAQGIRGT